MEFYKKFSAVLGKVQNPYKSAKNPHFKSNFAPLDEILEQLRPIVAAEGLCLYQAISTKDGTHFVKTVVTDGANSVEGEYPIVVTKPDPQGFASGITYARRYSLMAMFAIAGDDDDDGNTASGKPMPAERREPAKPGQQTTKKAGIGALLERMEKKLTEAQIKQVYDRFGSDTASWTVPEVSEFIQAEVLK